MEETTSACAALCLPAELTIYTVGELHPQWLGWLALNEPGAMVQGEAVEQVDSAGLQLLVALDRAVAERGRHLAVQSPSTVLRQGFRDLGLADWLDQHAAEATS